MKCVRCGEELPDGLNFCPFCGADLTVAEAPADDPADEPDVAEHVCVDREVPDVPEMPAAQEMPAAPAFVFPEKEEAPQDEEPGFDPYAHNKRRAEQVYTDRMPSGGASVAAPQGPSINVMMPAAEAALPEEYRPISMWGYIGYSLLFGIPLVGFILAIVYAFGGTQNVNLKNYSKAYFVLYLIGIGLGLLIVLIAVAAGLFYRHW